MLFKLDLRTLDKFVEGRSIVSSCVILILREREMFCSERRKVKYSADSRYHQNPETS